MEMVGMKVGKGFGVPVRLPKPVAGSRAERSLCYVFLCSASIRALFKDMVSFLINST